MPTKVKFWIELEGHRVEHTVYVNLPKAYTEKDLQTEYEEWVWDQVVGSWEVVDEENQGEAPEEGESVALRRRADRTVNTDEFLSSANLQEPVNPDDAIATSELS